MVTQEKTAAVEELKKYISDNTIAIMTQYQGITVAEVTALRTLLREQNITFKVYKNTLAKIALDELGLKEAGEFMEGPTVWAFSDDPVAPAKTLKDYAINVDVLKMVGGILDGKPIGSDVLTKLASLPSRDQLIAQVVSTIAMPLRNLVGTLSAVPRNMVNVLDQIRKQKEEADAA